MPADYMCNSCDSSYPESYVYWIPESGRFICSRCLVKDNELRKVHGLNLVVVKDVLLCNYKNDAAVMYILEGTEYRATTDAEEWAVFMNKGSTEPFHRHVALDEFYVDDKEFCSLSTVFLGVDHNFSSNNIPILFESMIFGGGSGLNESQERYASWANAATGHLFLCKSIINIISRKHKASSYKIEENGKLTSHYFQLEIKGLVQFTKDDIRLIRED
jgi:hypothetical protein